MKVITNYKTTLSASMTSSQNTVPVTSITTTDGHTITAADFDSVAYLVIEPGSANMEIVKVTDVSGGSFTGATRGLAFYGGTETAVSANQKAHQAGVEVIMTNAHYYFDKMMDLDSNETITGIKTFTAPNYPKMDDVSTPPVDDEEFATKKYVDDTAIAGSPKATETVYGIAKLSSAAADPTAPVVVNNEEVSAAGGTGAGENKIVKANASGYIDKDYIELDTDPGLEFDTNALGVKIKTSGGIVRDADGLSVDTGTTDGKIVQMTTGDKLPAVDGSQLTNLPQQTNFQIATTLSYLTYVIQGNPRIPAAADSDGNLFIGTFTPSTSYNALLLHRFQKDTTTGLYHKTHTIHSVVGGNGSWGNASFTVLGDYLYVVGGDNSNICRFDKANLANEIQMTKSGFSLGSESKFIWSDGTYLYVYARTGSYPIYKLSVPGTTATLDSTLITSIQNFFGGSWQDDTNFYAGSNDGVSIINKTTGAVTGSSAVIPLVGIEPSVFGCNLRVGDKIVNISLSNVDSNSQYARPVFSWYSSSEF